MFMVRASAMQPAVLHRVPGTGTPIAALAIGTHVLAVRWATGPGSAAEVAGDGLRWDLGHSWAS